MMGRVEPELWGDIPWKLRCRDCERIALRDRERTTDADLQRTMEQHRRLAEEAAAQAEHMDLVEAELRRRGLRT
jgi:hypothetical protein